MARKPPPGLEVYLASRRSPRFFVEKILGSELWSKQEEILCSVRDHQRTAVRSCHGAGKTKAAAYAVLWFLYCYPQSRVITTAPTWAQVEQLLWREIRAEFEKAPLLQGEIYQARLEIEPSWFALGLSTDKPERFQGHHAERILVVIDEASGVSREIFDAAEGYLTAWDGARLLLLGNPTQASGEFYDAFHAHRALYSLIAISAFDSPNLSGEEASEQIRGRLISQAWVEDKREKWGEGSVLWQVRVAGEFPALADDTVISLSAVEEAQARELQAGPEAPAVVGCDVARFGSDETVIAVLQGDRLRLAEAYLGRDLMETAGRVARTARSLGSRAFPQIVVDDDGVGGGVTDRLREQGFAVEAFRGGARPLDPRAYPNARSEAWFRFAERLPELDLDRDDQLAADLVAPRYRLDSQGRRVVEPKYDTKKRLGRSPDRADAALLCLSAGRTTPTEGPRVWV